MLGLIQLKPSWRDSESLRLGGALTWDDGAVVIPWWDLLRIRRAKAEDDGYWYIRPTENRYHWWDSLYPREQAGLTRKWAIYADVSVGYVEWMETEVVSSEAELNDPTTDEFTYIIGNGVYDSKQIITMFALGVRL